MTEKMEKAMEDLARRLERVCKKIQNDETKMALMLTMGAYMIMLRQEKVRSNKFYILGSISGLLQGSVLLDDGILQDEIVEAVYALNVVKKEMMEQEEEA